MPAINSGRANVNAAGKTAGKKKVRRAKAKVAGPPKPKQRVTVAPADRVAERVDARKQQVKRSVSASPDRQDTKRSPAQVKRDAQVVAENVKTARVKVAKTRRRAAIDARLKAGAKVSKSQAAVAAPVLKVLEQTTRPLHAIAAATDEALHGGRVGTIGTGASPGSVLKAAGRGLKNEDKTTFSDVIKGAGVKNKVVAGVAGTAADIAFDPTTYTTFGATSAAKQAATSAARNAEKTALKSPAAKAAGQKAAAQATKRGASTAEARTARKAAERKHASRAGKKAGEQAAQGKPTNNGLRIRFAGRDVPVVTRATAAAKRTPRAVARKTGAENTRLGRKVDRAQQRVRDTSRNLASDFNPAIAPAGVDREMYQAARRSARTARAGAQRGTYRAGQRAIAFRDAIGKGNYEKVLDAIETGTISSLPKNLRAPARELERDFAKMRKSETRAGLKVGRKPNYVKHLRIRPNDPRGGAPSVGSKKVAPSFGKARIEGTIAEKNLREPGAYSTDVADIYLNRGAESAVAVAKAKLNQSMVHAGRKPQRGVPIKQQLGGNESLYRVDGSDLVKVDPKSAEAKSLRKGDRYVILDEKMLSRTRGTVDAGAERSTAGVFFDKAQGVWKLAATQVNPGYHVRNFAGEAQNAYLAENPIVLGRNAVQAARALRQLGRDEDALRVLGKTPKENKHAGFVRDAEKVGAVRAGQLGREVQDMLGGQSAKNTRLKARRRALTRKPARALKNVEDVFRLATYKGGIDRGLPPERAMERASRNHFDYADLTPLERKALRRVAPFWTFSARNIPLQARTLLTRPGKFANYQKVREELQKVFEIPDDWEQDLSESEQRSAPLPVKIGGKVYTISLGPSGLPLTDLNEFPSTGDPVKQADEWIERAMSMLTPAAKTPVELWANMSFFFRDQIEKEDAPLAPAPSWVSKIPEKYRAQLGITENFRDPRSGKSGWGAPAKVVYALNVLPGPASFANRLSTESSRPGQSKTAKTVQYLGPRIRQTDPVTVRINKLFEEKAKVTKKLRTLGQQNHPGTEVKISAKAPTPEYQRLLLQQRKFEADILKLRLKRGDKGLQVPKGRQGSNGRVRLPGVSGRVSVPGSSSGRVKIP